MGATAFPVVAPRSAPGQNEFGVFLAQTRRTSSKLDDIHSNLYKKQIKKQTRPSYAVLAAPRRRPASTRLGACRSRCSLRRRRRRRRRPRPRRGIDSRGKRGDVDDEAARR